MFSKLANRFSPLVTLYNRLVVVKPAATTEYYYDAHQTEQDQKPFQYNLHATADQGHLIITDTTEQCASGDKMEQGNHDNDDFYVVGADSDEFSTTNNSAAMPSVHNGLSSSSSASNLVNYAYHAATIVAENTTRTAICGAARSCNFVWSEKKNIEEFVQEKTKKYAQPKVRGFGVDFANNPSIKFNLGAISPATAAA